MINVKMMSGYLLIYWAVSHLRWCRR